MTAVFKPFENAIHEQSDGRENSQEKLGKPGIEMFKRSKTTRKKNLGQQMRKQHSSQFGVSLWQ